MHFLFPPKFLTSQYKVNLSECFVWNKRLTNPCCVPFTLVFHISTFNIPVLSWNTLDMCQRKTLHSTFKHWSCKSGSWITSFTCVKLTLSWDQEIVGEAEVGNILLAVFKSQLPTDSPSPGVTYPRWWKCLCNPDGTNMWPCYFPTQPVCSRAGDDPIRHWTRALLHTESGDAVRCCFAALAMQVTLSFSSLGLFQPLVTLSNRERRVFSILEKRSLSLGYWTVVESSVPWEQRSALDL